ncbi:MAG: hypothetical protein ACE5JL_14840 [Dehalococcoidia bacterium]
MMSQDEPFLTTVVGSMPRPQYIKELAGERVAGRLSHDDFQQMMDKAVPHIIQMQEQAGLDIISDGEWRRVSYSDIIADICDGFRYVTKEVQGEQQRVPVVVEEMQLVRQGQFAREARFLKAHTQRRIKVAMPSPFLLGERLWDRELSAKAYPSKRAFTEALVPVLRQELIFLRDAAADVAQFDDTQFCLFVDPEIRSRYDDPEEEMNYCIEMLNRITEGVGGIKLALHLCRRYKGRSGWFGEGGYEAILPALSRLRFHLVLMEFAMPKAGGMEVLKELPDHLDVGIGCIDCRDPRIETPETVVQRVERALPFVAPGRVYMQPDCGFAPGSDMDIPIDEAYGKLKSMVEAAKRLRRKYGTGSG